MPRKGAKQKQSNPDDMEMAIAAVRTKKMGFLKASKYYSVPRSTLFRLATGEVETSPAVRARIPLGRKPVFNASMEAELVKYVLEMEARYFGLTRGDIRSLAFQL